MRNLNYIIGINVNISFNFCLFIILILVPIKPSLIKKLNNFACKIIIFLLKIEFCKILKIEWENLFLIILHLNFDVQQN